MKKATCIISLVILAASCVPQSRYDELEKKYYASLQGERKSQKAIQEKENELKSLSDQYSSLQEQQDALAKKKAQLDAEYSDLQIEYATRLKDMEDLKAKNAQIVDQVQTTEQSRKKILNELEQTQGQLQEKIKRINELENLISQQKESVSKLKNKLQIALKNYSGKGITVEEKDGNIYVSMENKLLFPSASWTVETEGIKALHDLSEVLSKDKNLNIIIQGHTDSDKYAGSGSIKDNWDLSVMRATAITKILQSEGVSPKQMTASGKSEYAPLASNSSATGKAANRRVDIIIAPNLSEITKILNDL